MVRHGLKHKRGFSSSRDGIKAAGALSAPQRNTGGGTPTVFALLLEDLTNLLMEDSGRILLEQ